MDDNDFVRKFFIEHQFWMDIRSRREIRLRFQGGGSIYHLIDREQFLNNLTMPWWIHRLNFVCDYHASSSSTFLSATFRFWCNLCALLDILSCKPALPCTERLNSWTSIKAKRSKKNYIWALMKARLQGKVTGKSDPPTADWNFCFPRRLLQCQVSCIVYISM